jgi:hypothetical protein
MLLQHAVDIGGLQPRLRIRDTVRPVCNDSRSAAGSKVPESPPGTVLPVLRSDRQGLARPVQRHRGVQNGADIQSTLEKEGG